MSRLVNRKYMKSLILVILVFLQTQLFAQVLTGKIIDAETGEPILFGTVYFASTSIGTISDADGKFKIWDFDPGKYDLTVSHVGHENYYLPLAFGEDERKEIVIELVPDLVKLPDFYLNPDTSGWEYNFQTFRNAFVGSTTNAIKTKITNPKNLFFYFDDKEQALFAHAKEPIVIENKALGYNVFYSLVEFEFNFKQQQLYTFGVSRFEPVKEKEKKRVGKARERAYNGSITHFFRSLRTSSLTKNGFVVEELFRVPNPNRPPQEEIDRNLEKYRALARSAMLGSTSFVISGSGPTDSLRYWNRMRREPAVIDSVGRKMNESSELRVDLEGHITYKGILRVQYLNEKEEFGYTRRSGKRYAEDFQTSVIHFLDDSLRLYENGYYEDVKSIFIEGYWSWSTNLAEQLPLDYSPNPAIESK